MSDMNFDSKVRRERKEARAPPFLWQGLLHFSTSCHFENHREDDPGGGAGSVEECRYH